MRKLTKFIAGFLTAALLLGGLSGCGAVGPVVKMFSEAITQAQQNASESAATEAETGLLPETETAEPETTGSIETETETETTAEETETAAPLETAERSDLLPAYVHYDATDFFASCKELTALAEKGDEKAVEALYEELYDEAVKIQDLYTAAEISASENASDKAWQAEKEYAHDLAVDTADAFCTACKTITQSKLASDFKAYINDDYVTDYFETYQETTDELKGLYSEETKLENEYYEIMDGINDITYSYNGKTYQFGDILEEDNSMAYNDRNTYLAVFEGCYKELNTQAGEIFVRLVKIRDQIAKLNGYDNYNDYADDVVYGRDYSSRDLEKMKTAVRRFGADYQNYLYYAYQQLPDYQSTGEELVEDTKNCVAGISPLVDKAFQYLTDNKVYSIGNEEKRIDAGFTTVFSESQVPFIFIKTSGNAYDVTTLVHESGHFTDAYFNANPYPLFNDGSYDIFEIHSTGLQLLAGDKYEKLFGDDASVLNAFNVLNLISYVCDGCIYDEWQRTIYENPDMTLDEINDLFKKVSNEYGVSDYTGLEYSWVEVSHNFASPMYYISYATSAFASLQIWLNSLNDYSSAVSTWEKIINAGAYKNGYMSVVKEAGLKTFDDSSAVYSVLNTAYGYAQQMVYGMAY